ncbi:PAS domain S-box protein [Desulfovibrio aminophilus]|nr:PAS domain S-box protein [Desulfovibrio aminophilus]MCM0754633.1 PAS domain S-box protein [Desulfovibrio aminophilus]
MPSVVPNPPAPSRTARRLTFFFTLSLLAVLAAFGVAIRVSLDNTYREAELETAYSAKVVQQHLHRALETVDLSLLHAGDRVRDRDWSRLASSEEDWRILSDLAARLPQVRSIWLADARGRMLLYSAQFPAPDLNVAQQEYFSRALALDGGHVIGPLLPGRFTGRPFFTVSRPVRDRRGRLLGVAVAALEPSYLAEFHARANLGNGAVALLSTDGVILSRYPFIPEVVGHKAPHPVLLEALAQKRIEGTLVMDGGPLPGKVVASFLRLAGEPLVVVANKPVSEIRETFLRGLPLMAGPLLLSLVFMTALFFVQLRKAREEDQSRAALAESEARFRLVTEHAGEIISLHDAEGRVIFMSPSCIRVTGYPPEIMASSPPEEFIHPPDWKIVQDDLARPVYREKRHAKATFRVRHADGRIIWLEVGLSPVLNEKGEVAQAIAIGRDVTARRELEELKEHVEHITRHDLKTPLICALSVPRILRGHGNLRPDQLQLLDHLEKTSRKMLDMINRSLDLYKMEAGIYAVRPVSVDLLGVALAGVEEMRNLARARGLEVAVRVDGAEPELGDMLLVRGEDLLLQSLFLNLLANALEAAPEGGTVGVELSREERFVRLAVHNMGAVPEAVRGRFFEKYSTHGKEFGTGLGTYAVRLIAEVHGGSVGFETGEERGTTVWVLLPAPPPSEA